jgi:hypothetical protein
MDSQRFDRLVRTLRTRRSALGLISGIAALLGAGRDDAAAKKCKKPCGPCKRCKKGKCRLKKPDGTPCGDGGTCLSGTCCVPSCAGNACNSSDGCGGDCLCDRGQACLSGGTCGACPADAECANTPCGETNAGDPCRCVVSVEEQPACVSINLADGVLTDESCSDAACTTALGKPAVCMDFACVGSGFWCLPDCGAA